MLGTEPHHAPRRQVMQHMQHSLRCVPITKLLKMEQAVVPPRARHSVPRGQVPVVTRAARQREEVFDRASDARMLVSATVSDAAW